MSVQRPANATRIALAALASAALTMLGGAALAQSANGKPQLDLPRAKLSAGMHVIDAQVAAEVDTRAKGLMYRDSLPGNEGMLFVFERAAEHCFWMRNTPLPLSIAFIAQDGELVNIADMAPFSEQSHCPLRPVRYALEMAQGWFARKGVKPGSKITGLPAVR